MWSLQLRSCLIFTASNLKVETRSNWWFPHDANRLYDIIRIFHEIYKHFFTLQGIYLHLMTNTKIVSLTAKFQMLKELCSRTSKTVVSSTYLALTFQSLKSLFIIIENRVTSILVPWGMPPWVCFH